MPNEMTLSQLKKLIDDSESKIRAELNALVKVTGFPVEKVLVYPCGGLEVDVSISLQTGL